MPKIIAESGQTVFLDSKLDTSARCVRFGGNIGIVETKACKLQSRLTGLPQEGTAALYVFALTAIAAQSMPKSWEKTYE